MKIDMLRDRGPFEQTHRLVFVVEFEIDKNRLLSLLSALDPDHKSKIK